MEKNNAEAKVINFSDPSLYVNRELSWLEFNWRVLHEAQDERNPLLERLKFAAITENNLDEFAMKRIGGLKRQVAARVSARSLDGMTPTEQLQALREQIYSMTRQLDAVLHEKILPELAGCGVYVCTYEELDDSQREYLNNYFKEAVFPILTPLGVDAGHPFPFISNLSLSLAVYVKSPADSLPHLARIKIPQNRPRWIQLPQSHFFVPIEEVIAQNLQSLFPGTEVLEVASFRVTRNANLERDEEEADDLLELIQAELRFRRFAPVVLLEVSDNMSDGLLARIMEELELHHDDVYRRRRFLACADFMQLADEDFPELKFESWNGVTHPRLRELETPNSESNIFDIIKEGDILLHHPYQSFNTSVLRLLEAAADDPHVLAIKQTLYRTAPRSPIIAALQRASQHGKQVAVMIEIKARFDEARNIEWVHVLEEAGVHVSYGFVGFKTHSKTLLVVREEHGGLRRYVHIGTGNYHTGTAKLYTDFGLLSCDSEIADDLTDLFNFITGHCRHKDFNKLLIAPFNMKQRFLAMIKREAKRHESHGDGRIVAKMNQLEDSEIIESLYRASCAGVAIDLIVRGFCCLRPGVPGVSENIRVFSLLGRFLEHSRIFYFHNGGDEEMYIGSADWMSRNLNQRIEAVVPIESKPIQSEIKQILMTMLGDNRQIWEMQSDGHYVQRVPPSKDHERSSHIEFMRQAKLHQ